MISITRVVTPSEKDSASSSHAWVWLPGWSYTATVFEPLYSALPGIHFLVDYHCDEPMAKAVEEIGNCTPDNAVWCGWSLGGALAHRICTNKPHKGLVTLGTGRRFVRSESDTWGMPEDEFATFCTTFMAAPEKTLKRFNALTTQGSSNARLLARSLGAHQSTPSSALTTSLNWLGYEALPTPNQQSNREIHIYSSTDALNPGGLIPQTLSPGNSHAFFLEANGHEHLLMQLQNIMNLNGESDA